MFAADRRVLVLMRTRGHSPAADRIVSVLSRTGEHAALWLALGAAGAVTTREENARRAWLRGMLAVGGAVGINYAVKLTVRRPRPVLAGLPPLTGTVSSLSFPSAHATTSFTAVAAYRRVAPRGPLLAVAVALAASRPYLGVHYPSDVLAGAALGTAIGALSCP